MISVPGTRPGSTMATTGAASMPMPNPMEPCRQDAKRTAIATTANPTVLIYRRFARPAQHLSRVGQCRLLLVDPGMVALGGVSGYQHIQRQRWTLLGAAVGGGRRPSSFCALIHHARSEEHTSELK